MRVRNWIWPRFPNAHAADTFDGHLRTDGDISYYTSLRSHARIQTAQRITSTVFFVLVIVPLGILAFATVVFGVFISATIVWYALT